MNLRAQMRDPFLAILVVAIMFGCRLFQEELETTTKQGFYAIQPETFLEELAHGNNQAFSPITAHDVDYSIPPGSSVNWTQSDYFQIVESFYELILNDKLDDWHLSSMSFSLNCDEVDVGLQAGRFQFFKIVKDENDQEVRIVRLIAIDPRYRFVSLWEREFSPRIIDWSSIDLNSMKFDNEQALQIAEDNGGQNQRLSLNNACSIAISLSPNSAQYRGWNIFYTRHDNRRIAFEVKVDPFTGEIR